MLFNSFDFALFLPITFFLYWFIFSGTIRRQNVFIVCASYLFYGWWNWKLCFLMIISTLVTYLSGKYIYEIDDIIKKKRILLLTVFVNLSFLIYFKYFNFFIDSFMKVFTLFGMNIPFRSFDIVLPVGISFYTFQTMSYSIDIYKKKLNPVQDLISYAAFVSFFPQLVAGPIERAVDLLPQFLQERKFTYKEAIQGCKQILWGLFKKIAIADIAASYVNQIFNNFRIYNSSALTLGAIFFALQIYCDFSGYSDIAIGVSKLFGIKLSKNFSFPYFSRNVAEFWRRWHITLTSWFRDYVYIPLGGSKYNTCKSIRNIFIVFILSGLWHGANWTFITWGVMNAIYFIPSFCMKKNRKYLTIIAESSKLPTASEFLNMVITFVLNTISWIVFRSKDLSEALSYIRNIFKISILNFPNVTGGGDKINRLHNFNFFVYDFRMERTKTQLCY